MKFENLPQNESRCIVSSPNPNPGSQSEKGSLLKGFLVTLAIFVGGIMAYCLMPDVKAIVDKAVVQAKEKAFQEGQDSILKADQRKAEEAFKALPIEDQIKVAIKRQLAGTSHEMIFIQEGQSSAAALLLRDLNPDELAGIKQLLDQKNASKASGTNGGSQEPPEVTRQAPPNASKSQQAKAPVASPSVPSQELELNFDSEEEPPVQELQLTPKQPKLSTPKVQEPEAKPTFSPYPGRKPSSSDQVAVVRKDRFFIERNGVRTEVSREERDRFLAGAVVIPVGSQAPRTVQPQMRYQQPQMKVSTARTRSPFQGKTPSQILNNH